MKSILILSTATVLAACASTTKTSEPQPLPIVVYASNTPKRVAYDHSAKHFAVCADCTALVPTPKTPAASENRVSTNAPITPPPTPRVAALDLAFATSTTTLTDSQRDLLARNKSRACANNQRQVEVTGRADYSGHREGNERMALARARAVQQALAATPIPGCTLAIASRTEIAQPNKVTDIEASHQRRASVLFSEATAAPTQHNQQHKHTKG
jgi:outer membrane protein OmpA-like peptidoglycan-associated protein